MGMAAENVASRCGVLASSRTSGRSSLRAGRSRPGTVATSTPRSCRLTFRPTATWIVRATRSTSPPLREPRRRAPTGDDHERACCAQASGSRRRHGDCRQLLSAERRRGGGARDVGVEGCSARSHPARSSRGLDRRLGSPEIMGLGPPPAIQALLRVAGMKLEDIDIVESTRPSPPRSSRAAKSSGSPSRS